MVNKPLIRHYFWGGGVALGGVARIPMKIYVNIPYMEHPPGIKTHGYHQKIHRQQDRNLGPIGKNTSGFSSLEVRKTPPTTWICVSLMLGKN